MSLKIALTGNPNVGKTSLFNRLTHSFEHVGNWHGVTVKKVAKTIKSDGLSVQIDDLPGLYSLTVYSYEESVARDSILSNDYDVIINICEVNNLSRNLYLTLQLLELDVPVVLVVNMVDELKKRGQSLDVEKLQDVLGLPVVPLSAKYKIDSRHLLDVCAAHAKSFKGNKVDLSYLKKLPLSDMSQFIKNAQSKGLNSTFCAIKLLENDNYIKDRLNLSEQETSRLSFSKDRQALVATSRYEFIDSITQGIITKDGDKTSDNLKNSIERVSPNISKAGNENAKDGIKSDIRKDKEKSKECEGTSRIYRENAGKIDKIVLNKYLALPIFLFIMAIIFVITFGFLGKWMSDGLEYLIERFIYQPLTDALEGAGVWQWLTALVGEGIINGVGGILVFLPQIVLLFFFLALLEDSGYISRVAFMTDGLFRKIGLSGRSAFTMLMGFGCSATAVLTARGLEDQNMRKKTVLLTPFMSCSARLPVYSAIGGAFFFGGNALVIFALYFLGAAVAFILAAIMEKFKRFKSGKLSFIMEMPPYRLPTLERVRQLIWNNSKVFIIRVGTVIFGLNVIVWLLSNFSIYGYTAGTDYASFLETFSGFIAPIFSPLGFGNWEAVTSLMSGLVAKESVLATIESLGGIDVIFSGANPALTALCFLVFTLLYVPCFATLSAIAKEISFKFAVISFVLQMCVAYIVSLIFRLIGLLFIYNTAIAVSLLLIIVLALLIIFALRYSIKHKTCKSCSGCASKGNCSKK